MQLRTEPIKLHVRPLPKYGKPKSFLPLVGEFTLKSEIGKTEFPLGESTTLTVVLEGDGNLRDASISELKWESIKMFLELCDNSFIKLKKITNRCFKLRMLDIRMIYDSYFFD